MFLKWRNSDANVDESIEKNLNKILKLEDA